MILVRPRFSLDKDLLPGCSLYWFIVLLKSYIFHVFMIIVINRCGGVVVALVCPSIEASIMYRTDLSRMCRLRRFTAQGVWELWRSRWQWYHFGTINTGYCYKQVAALFFHRRKSSPTYWLCGGGLECLWIFGRKSLNWSLPVIERTLRIDLFEWWKWFHYYRTKSTGIFKKRVRVVC